MSAIDKIIQVAAENAFENASLNTLTNKTYNVLVGTNRNDISANDISANDISCNDISCNNIKVGGNVGIGTINPTSILHLKSTEDCVIRMEADSNDSGGENDNPLIYMSQDNNGGNSYFKIGMVGDANQNFTGSIANGAFISTEEKLQIATNAQARMTILQTGYVGIGTTSPECTLDVRGDIKVTEGISFRTNHTGADYSGNNINSSILDWGSQDGLRYNGHRGHVFTVNNGVECVKIVGENGSDSGNVGIGTTSPTASLHIKTSSTSTKSLRIYHNNAEAYASGNNPTAAPTPGTNPNIYNPAGTLIDLEAYSNSETTKAAFITFNAYNIVGGACGAYFGAIGQGTLHNTAANLAFGRRTGTSTFAESMRIDHDGNVGIGNNNPGYKLHVSGSLYYSSGGLNGSDRRIKTNIVDVSDNQALTLLRNIPCRYYEYIDKKEMGDGNTIGFIAQEVKEQFPMAVKQHTQEIPNEYREIDTSNIETIYFDNSNNIQPNQIIDSSGNKQFTEKFKLTINDLSNSDMSQNYAFCSNTEYTSRFELTPYQNPKSFLFDNPINYLFLYGKVVNDFHALDKSKLFALNFSATQELDRQQQADKARIAALESENATLKSQIASVLERLTAAGI